MMTTLEAFKTFKSRLELRTGEQARASKLQKEVRELIGKHFTVDRDFLTGSYGRHTKTRPLKDVDIFFVLNRDKESKYLDKPLDLLQDIRKVLAPIYGEDKVKVGRRSVCVDLPYDPNDEDKIISIDVVPAFQSGTYYQIPDTVLGKWVYTDPEIHAEKATAANKAFDCEWKPMVKMIKKWNEIQGKPIKPSFLIEVMALQILYPPFSGGYIYELKSFFATAADRIAETWSDPAGLGAPVSDQMDTARITLARQKLVEAGKNLDQAIQLERNGNQGGALRTCRENIFGDLFPIS